MKKVVLIGAGQLGSRYLQGLALSKSSFHIEVVEPFKESAKVAKERYEQIKPCGQKSISFFSQIDDISNEIDLAIISTNSDVRADIIKELLGKKNVKNLILEKVLFQKFEDYENIEFLLKEKDVNTWVNHTRRLFPFYQKLQQELLNSKFIHFNVIGGNWGLGSNGLHMLDLLLFLSSAKNDCIININNNLLKYSIDSKRKGHKEIIGILNGQIDNYTFTIGTQENNAPDMISIITDSIHLIINEAEGWTKYSSVNNDWKWEEESIKILYFQSEITSSLVDNILENSGCNLPDYTTAKTLHLPFLESIWQFLKKDDVDLKHCPLT